ncbi:helix-turn-helix domain-containing protein [Ancylobacter terrae]|uniref:helix-turn-helix domain-containing protein n=1 Tax=Ancylobacter sp. sgz301288 TaxID=3342077 RepID=UPI00385B8CA8
MISHIGSISSIRERAVLARDRPRVPFYDACMSSTPPSPVAPPKVFFLREWRKAKKLTQETLAERLDLHVTGVGKYERGEREPGPTMIVAIASALGVSPGDLFRDPAEASLDGLVQGLTDEQRAHITKAIRALADAYR